MVSSSSEVPILINLSFIESIIFVVFTLLLRSLKVYVSLRQCSTDLVSNSLSTAEIEKLLNAELFLDLYQINHVKFEGGQIGGQINFPFLSY